METKFAWHVHHDILLEPLLRPLKTRIAYIRRSKPQEEIEGRLRLLKLVKGELPAEIIEAGRAWVKAFKPSFEAEKAKAEADKASPEAVWLEADETLFKAERAWFEALERNREAVEKLHWEECPDCPFRNRKSIFPVYLKN